MVKCSNLHLCCVLNVYIKTSFFCLSMVPMFPCSASCSIEPIYVRPLASARHDGQTFRPTRLFMGDLLMATSKERLVEETKLFYGLMKAMNFSGNSRVLNAVLQLFLEVSKRALFPFSP